LIRHDELPAEENRPYTTGPFYFPDETGVEQCVEDDHNTGEDFDPTQVQDHDRPAPGFLYLSLVASLRPS
jgi:hypothetical protein